MIKIRTRDGQEFQANNAKELVRQLHLSSLSPEASDEAFMEAAAERASLQTGKPVSFASPGQFINDLLSTGLIWEIN